MPAGPTSNFPGSIFILKDELKKIPIFSQYFKKLGFIFENVGFIFLFAPLHHEAMKYVMPVRQKIAKKTIFNLLGPLTNPASTKKQLLGVFEKKWVRTHCEVLKELGSSHSMVVHGLDGLDEISLSGPSYISELKDGGIKFEHNFYTKNKIFGENKQ